MAKLKGVELLYNLILKDIIKNSGQASGIMSIGDSVRKLADNRLQSYLVSAFNKGIDLNKFSESQLKYMLEMNKPYNRAKMQLRKEQGIKSADVFNIEGQKLDPNKPIIGGTQTGKELSPELSERLRGTEVERIKQKIADKKIDDDLDKKADGGRIGLKDGFPSREENLRLLKEELKEIFRKQTDPFPKPGGKEFKNFKLGLENILSKSRPKNADGGRIGLKDGPKFDIQATGSKSGRQQIDKAPEGITRDQETFQAIMNADIPLNDKLNFLAKLQYGKDRIRIDKDKDELVLFEGGFKDRKFGLGFNEGKEGFSGRVMYGLDTNEPEFKIGFSKKFAGGGRVGLKDGMDRRKFLKIMGGLASIPILGKFFKLAKVAEGTKVASDVASTVSKSTPPPYFFELAKTIKKFGKPDKTTYQDRIEIHRMVSKDGKSELQLTEDLSTGNMQIKKIKPEEDMVNEDIVLEFRKGDVDVDLKTGKAIKEPDEYTEGKEVTQRIYKDNYNEPDFYEGEGVDEIIKEVREAPPIKKAGGGIARVGYFLGSGRQAGTALIREILKYFNKDQKISVSEMLRTFNTRELRKLLDELSTYKKFDVKESGMPMPQIIEDKIKKLNVGKEKVLESVLGAANAARRLETDLALRQNKMIEDAVNQGFDRQEAKELVEGMTTAIEKSAGGPPRFKTATDEGIMDVEMMLKDLKTQGDGRKLNASGGVAYMLGE